jgi:hypothetical protein
VRERAAREPAVLYIVYIDACVGGERYPREESDNRSTCLEERDLMAAYLGLRLPQPVSVEGDGAPKVAHAKCNEAQPWFHCSAPFSCIEPLLRQLRMTVLSRRRLWFSSGELPLYEEGNTTCIRDEWQLDTGRPADLERLTGRRVKSAVAENLTKLKELLEECRVVLQDGSHPSV